MKLLSLIEEVENKVLPGWEAQSKMASPIRQNFTFEDVKDIARYASVLILLYERNGKIVFPLNKRHVYEGIHSGQIGLPGGSVDDSDSSNEDTAIRETEEELSILRKNIKIIRPMSKIFVPPSRFLVSPFLGYLEDAPTIVKEDKEVKEVLEIDIEEILNPANVQIKTVSVYNISMNVPAFVFNNEIVWGATAMILSEFAELIKNK